MIARCTCLLPTMRRSSTIAWWYSSREKKILFINVCTVTSVNRRCGPILCRTPGAVPMHMPLYIARYVPMVLTCVLNCALLAWTGALHCLFIILPQEKGKYVQTLRTSFSWCNGSLTLSCMLRWIIEKFCIHWKATFAWRSVSASLAGLMQATTETERKMVI